MDNLKQCKYINFFEENQIGLLGVCKNFSLRSIFHFIPKMLIV